MAEFIEILSPSALKDLTTANNEVVKLISNINSAGQAMQSIKTPSGSDSAVKNLSNNLIAQEKNIQKVQQALEKARIEEIKLQKAREDAIDKYNNNLAKQEALITKQTAKQIAESQKIIAQKEKEFREFEKQFNKYEADLAKKAIAEQKANQKAIQDGERRRLEEIKLQQAREKAFDKYDAQLAKERNKKQALTSEEIVNQQVLRTNADRHARATSNLVGAYANLNAQHQIASRRLQDLIVRGRTAEQTQRQYNRELRQAQNEFQQLDRRIQSADRAVGRFNRNVGNYPRQAVLGIKDLLGAFGIATGLQLIADVVKDVYQLTKELQSLNMALLQVTGSQIEFANQQTFLKRIAEDYGVEINDLTKMFTQFYVSANDKIAGKDIQNIFESITKAGASMGLSQESMQRAFLALNQIMAKGSVQAEELKGQLSEALPGALGIMAKSLGVTEGKLMDMMKAGEVSSDALIGFAQQLEKTYGIENVKRIDNIASAQNRLANSWTNLVAVFSEDDGFLSRTIKNNMNILAIGLELVSETLKNAEQKRNDFKKSQLEKGRQFSEQQVEELREQGKNEIEVQKYIIDEEARLRGLAWEAFLKAKQIEVQIRSGIGKKAQSETRKELQSLNNLITLYNGKILGLRQFLKPDRQKEETKIDEKELKKRAKLYEDFLKNRNLREISDLERFKKILEDRYDEDFSYAKDRIKISEDILKVEQTIADKQFIENRRLHKDSVDLMAIDANNYRTQTEKNEKAHQDRVLKIKKDSFQDFLDYREKYGKPADEEMFGQGVNYLPTNQLDELINKWDEYKDKQKEALDETKSYFEKHGEEIVDLSQDLINTLAEISNQRFENQLSNLEKEKNTAILFAGDSVTAREEIERQAEVRRRAILARQAKAQKEMAIFNIITDTAQAVVASLKRDPSGTLAILIGAIGAANIALVASQQVPAFKDGGTHDGGLMMVNDQKGSKYKEIVETPDGKKRIFNERNKVLNAPKGTKIYNATDTESILFNNELNGILTNNGISSAPTVIIDGGLSKDDFNSGISKLAKTINEKESFSISRDKRGERVYREKQNKRTELLNIILKAGRYDV